MTFEEILPHIKAGKRFKHKSWEEFKYFDSNSSYNLLLNINDLTSNAWEMEIPKITNYYIFR